MRNPTFVTLSDGSIRNTYDVRLRNMNLEDRTFQLSLTSEEPLNIALEGQEGLTVVVPANQMMLQRVYITAPADSGGGGGTPDRVPALGRRPAKHRPRLQGDGLQRKRGVTAMREITGRHVLIGTVAAFGVIIAANVTLAVNAVRTFPGLEVKNSYEASQVFDREKAAQKALGWTMDAGLADGTLRIAFTGPDGRAVRPATVTAKVGRATEAVDDHTPRPRLDGRRLHGRGERGRRQLGALGRRHRRRRHRLPPAHPASRRVVT